MIFIAGNMPFKSEIAPLLIITQLEEYDYVGAAAIATVMLMVSFAMLLVLNLLQHWQQTEARHVRRAVRLRGAGGGARRC